MLNGKHITLRPVTENDLPQIYAHFLNLDNRGEFYGTNIRTMSELRRDFAEHGFWKDDFGILLLVDNESDRVLGQIAWYSTVMYLDEIEIGYILWEESRRSKGTMTEALMLFTHYLFDIRPLHSKPVNRIRLCIATGNIPSRRVAEKAGYMHEATQREAGYGRNRRYDVELYAIIRSDPRPTI